MPPRRPRPNSLFPPSGGGGSDAPGVPGAPGESGGAPPSGTITVTQLNERIALALAAGLPPRLLVAGELSNVSQPASGHIYFTLKDDGSEVRCAMWRSAATSLKFRPLDGLSVVAVGKVDVYVPRGQVQFYVQRLEPIGIGALELALRQLREKLAAEGLFDPARKRPLPSLPKCIAVVTSPTGAAIRDILRTIHRRFPCVTVMVYPVRVQGDGAAAEIAAAINAINRNNDQLEIDVMIVGRGGGSLEDLWAFNEESVARAVYASRIPIVSAVGHEVDTSISDLVADVRAATPTAAAELVTPVRTELLELLDAVGMRLRRAVVNRAERLNEKLRRLAAFQLFRDPLAWLYRHEQHIDEAAAQLRAAVTHQLSTARKRLHAVEARLWRVRPEAVLARRHERLMRLEHRLRWAQGKLNLARERQLERAANRIMHAIDTRMMTAREKLDDQAHRIRWAQGHENLASERRLSQLAARMLAASPRARVRQHLRDLRDHESRLRRGTQLTMRQLERALAAFQARMHAAGHEQILARGFSITRIKRTGEVVRDAAALHDGTRITTRTADGEFDSKVVDRAQGDLFE